MMGAAGMNKLMAAWSGEPRVSRSGITLNR